MARSPRPPRITAFGLSIAFHVAVAVAILIAAGIGPETVATKAPPIRTDLVYLQQAAGTGGGGGSSRQAAPAKVQIPEHVQPSLTVTATTAAVDPPPVLDIAVRPNSTILQGGGVTLSAPPGLGGGGNGPGLGSGNNSGINDGEKGGTGGPGSGGGVVTSPQPLRPVRPDFTPGALAAKIQGTVTLEIEVLANGTVGNVKVIKSLDRVYGLDQAAIRAARQWLFVPGRMNGKPVDVVAQLILEFNLR